MTDVVSVQLLYFEGCPHWRTADQRLQEALRLAGCGDHIEYRKVEATENAEAASPHGSPTVLIEGVDPFNGHSAPGGESCRLYSTPQGLAGAPTLDQLLEVLAPYGGPR